MECDCMELEDKINKKRRRDKGQLWPGWKSVNPKSGPR
jgi:hypothetical protein